MDKIIYALKDDKLVSINDVEAGLDCGCVCPSCHQPLVAKKGNIKVHHFAHYSKTSCEHAYESSLHLLAKKIFEDVGSIVLPRIMFGNYGAICVEEEKCINVKNVEIEKSINDIKPDIIVKDEEGNKYSIEIFVTHKVDDEKLEKIKREKINTIEYDLSKINKLLTYEELKDILLYDQNIRKWIYHTKIEETAKKYSLSVGMLGRCYKQRGYSPNWSYCLTHCEHNIGMSDDQTVVYCKRAEEILPQPGGRCPECNSKLVLRNAYSPIHKRRHTFWGCSNYPNCKFTKRY